MVVETLRSFWEAAKGANSMTNLNLKLPDHMMEFVETRIGPGKFKDAHAYLQFLIAEDMQNYQIAFTDDEKARIDQKLLEALEEIERGECRPWEVGEALEDLERRIEAQRKNPQPGEAWDKVKREIRHGDQRGNS
jgi:Arc/MetJ-type ribon-helix-helix transcriptional regulator